MRSFFVVLALLLATAPATAVNTENYRIPYLGLMVDHLRTDPARNTDDGYGYQLTFGVPFKDQRRALEVTLFDHAYARALDGRDNFQTGILIDYVRDFGPPVMPGTGGDRPLLRRLKPFLVAGLGFIEEDTFGDKHLHPTAEAGGGVLIPVGGNGWALRLDARAAFQFNTESANGENGTRDQDSVLDMRVMAGLQIPMTAFYDREVPVPEAADCEIAVVDPDSGRRDCATDSDRDGVEDPLDQCPGTLPGIAVLANGCPVSSGDRDSDQVADATDRCPGTLPGLRVDNWGCVVPQTLTSPDLSFAPESATLTPQAQRLLDALAGTLVQQPQLRLEIAVHTDAIASPAYNLMLSQRRAEAARDYLLRQGMAQSRITAIGHGESEPLASNETEEGRARNRRIELRFWY